MALQRRETRSGKVRWVARWRDKGGKEHSRSFDTKREAKQHLADVEVRAARGADTAPQKVTVRDVFDGWLATRDVREGTRAAYKDVRDRQLKPLLGYPVREVSAADVMEWTAQLREGRPWVSRDDEGLAESTVHTILVTVASCFKWAVQEGFIGVHFHALRHFFVSSLLTAGVPVQDVARVAGHTPATTLATYAHVLDGYEARVGAALDSLSSGIGAGSGGLRLVD